MIDTVKERAPLSLRGLRAALLLAGLAAWWLVYRNLEAFARWLVHDLLSMAANSRLTSALEFFVYEAPKVLMLLFVVVFGVGIVRSFFTPERTRRMLAGRRQTVGNVLAALLGVVTPFCSCSAVPLFIGFVTTGVPLGVTFSFLISAPMVNEVALVLLFGLFGWKVAALYLGTGLAIATIAGWTIGRLHLERWVEGWVYQTKTGVGPDEAPLAWADRVRAGRDAVKDIVGKVWPYVLAGIAVGAGIHGYVPENFMASIMGKGRVVVGSAGGPDRRAHVLQCGWHHSRGAGAPWQGRGAGHGAGLHDVRDRAVTARDDHPAQGTASTAHCCFRGGGCSRNSASRLPLQHRAVGRPQ
jgi:Predicted permeases